MSDKEPVIEVSGISKSYTISHQHKAQYGSLRDNLMSFFDRPFLKKGQTESVEVDKEQFWALKDISFTVNRGEIFGVLGRNGSGKSTLLKILSRIVEPTSGKVAMRGKVASLLEVGTGFHPELTGRENVFFNGSMLGMSRDEVGKKFDEIVQFAEIEKFLDTPVKFYSSGMYVRLAFSVAAHLEPDILILDEVLAVGDAAFQKKSLNKILETMNQNRTVLFVSHSMESVEGLCNRALLLHEGKIKLIDKAEVVTEAYREDNAASLGNAKISAEAQPERVDESYGKQVTIKELSTAKEGNAFFFDESLAFTAALEAHEKSAKPVLIGIGVNSPTGSRIFTYESTEPIQLKPGSATVIKFKISSPRLVPGDYSLSFGVRIGNETVDFIPDAIGFRIKKRNKKGGLYTSLHDPAESGFVLPSLSLEVKND